MARGSTLWILFACIVVLVIANPDFKGKQGCKLKGGKILKEKQSQKSGCYEYKCLKKKGKFFLKEKLRKNKCCKLKRSVVPNKWTSMRRGNLTSCISGKLQVNINPSKKVIRKEMEKSILQELLKFDHHGVAIRSLEKFIPFVDLLIGKKRQKRKPSELLKKEFENIVKKHNFTGYIYGIENIVNLIENEKLKNLITSKINQLRRENGYRKLEFRNANRTMNHRVYYGDRAKVGDIPFQARIEIETCDSLIVCGGVLISPFYVLTAEHCMRDVRDPHEDVKIIMGEPSSTLHSSTRQLLKVLYVHKHESEDIALISLRHSAKLSSANPEAVKTIPILENPDYTKDAKWGYVSGWGQFYSGHDDDTDLRYRKVLVPKWDTCRPYTVYPDTDPDTFYNTQYVCAKYGCLGDSGGPLFFVPEDTGSGKKLEGTTRKYLWGIISKAPEKTRAVSYCDDRIMLCVDVAWNGVNHWIKEIVGTHLGQALQSYESMDNDCHIENCRQYHKCPSPVPCFAASSRILLHNGQIKPISELMVGDKILAGNIQRKPIFSKFIGWLHKDKKLPANFLKISSKVASITLTPAHLILSKSQDYDRNIKYVFAKDIKIGDQVTMKLDNNTFTWAVVTQIQQRMETGVFAPLTEEGTVVVDGILASTYTGVDHDLAHAAFSIVRYFPSLLENAESQHLNGIRTFPKVLVAIARMLNLWEEDVSKEEEKENTFCTILYFALGLWIIVYIKKTI